MAITEITAPGFFDTFSESSASTGSWTPTANALVLAFTTSTDSIQISSISGNSLTWVQVTSRVVGTRTVEFWRAMSSSPTTGATTFNLNGTTSNFAIDIMQFAGVNTSGTNGSGAIAQRASNAGSGVSSLAVTLSTLGSGSASVGGMAFSSLGAVTISPGSGYTEDYGAATAPFSFEAEYKLAGSTTVDWSWSGAHDAAGVAVEVQASGGPAVGMIPI